ncbi:LOW QUALITY PROTEIN: hypothetical protein V2J09_011491 [Rumex salicifolius]
MVSNKKRSPFRLNLYTFVLFLLVYVDDIIVTSSSASVVIAQLRAKFALKHLGCLSYFLGVKVHPTPDGLFPCQRKYITDLLAKAGMSDCKPASTPLSASPSECHNIVGNLQYLNLNVQMLVNVQMLLAKAGMLCLCNEQRLLVGPHVNACIGILRVPPLMATISRLCLH